MYPQNFYALFPPFPRNKRVFVAMSFDERFADRYENVIAPGIRQVRINGVPLEPHRVDASTISDSALTEILDGISNNVLVLADVTSIGTLDGKANGRVVRNDNVMYEIGLAHAIRLPEEVLIVRSDSEQLSFDLANVRVNEYWPDQDVEKSKHRVTELILESLKGVDQRRNLAVKKAAHGMDATDWVVLSEASSQGDIRRPSSGREFGLLGTLRRDASIKRLLDLGAIRANYVTVTQAQTDASEIRVQDLVKYELTAFGKAVLAYFATQITDA